MPKQPTWVLIAFVATLVFGFLFLARAYSGCPEKVSGFTVCTVYEVAKDFKEVFGWAIAMYVAYIAASPVWQQLKLMRVDVDISSIKFLEEEIEALRQIRANVQKALTPLTSYIQEHSRIEEDGTWNGNVHAVHDAEHKARRALDFVNEMHISFEKSFDDVKLSLIDAISRIEECFGEMNLEVYIDLYSENYNDADLENAHELGKVAAGKIDARIADLNTAQSQFDAAITNAIAARTRLISDKKTAMVS